VDKNEEVTYKLVTSEDANVTAGLISKTSPIGRSLLNKREGDTVEVKIPSGTRTFEIISFTTIHDQQRDASPQIHHRTDRSRRQTRRGFHSERSGQPSHPSQHPDVDRNGDQHFRDGPVCERRLQLGRPRHTVRRYFRYRGWRGGSSHTTRHEVR